MWPRKSYKCPAYPGHLRPTLPAPPPACYSTCDSLPPSLHLLLLLVTDVLLPLPLLLDSDLASAFFSSCPCFSLSILLLFSLSLCCISSLSYFNVIIVFIYFSCIFFFLSLMFCFLFIAFLFTRISNYLFQYPLHYHLLIQFLFINRCVFFRPRYKFLYIYSFPLFLLPLLLLLVY